MVFVSSRYDIYKWAIDFSIDPRARSADADLLTRGVSRVT